MPVLKQLEDELRRRENGWWDRLGKAIPELAALSGTPQPQQYHAEGDVDVHTRMAIEACPNNCDPDLLWVALLHDIGKPATTHQDELGRITAHGHAKLGAEMAETILTRLEMPESRRNRITWAIRHHMFHHSWQLKNPDDLTKKQHNYITSDDFPLLLEFLRVDSMASHGKADSMQAYDFYRQLWVDLPNRDGDTT